MSGAGYGKQFHDLLLQFLWIAAGVKEDTWCFGVLGLGLGRKQRSHPAGDGGSGVDGGDLASADLADDG